MELIQGEPITEEQVKRAALRFLKGYYRHWPRKDGQTIVKKDLRGEGNIIADGYLQFQKVDDTPFVATFEATSYAARGEVLYQVQQRLLVFDSLAVALLLTDVFLILIRDENWFNYQDASIWWIFTLAWLIFLLSFLGIRLLLRPLYRYRYIYAVAQFKNYFADDQWIALADDVFASPRDPYFLELKKQCVRYGFGLLQVFPNMEVQLIIAAAREEQFKQKRQRIQLVELPTWTEQISKRMPTQRMRSLRQRFRARANDSLSRFRTRYNKQIGISLVALIVMIAFFYRKSQEVNIRFREAEEVVADLDRRIPNAVPEPKGYIIDTAFLDQFADIQGMYFPGQITRERARKKPGPVQPQARLEELYREGRVIVVQEGESLAYDCARFANLEGTHYVVADGFFIQLAAARDRLELLRRRGLTGGLIWPNCTDNNQEDFLVFLGPIFTDRTVAQAFQYRAIDLYDEVQVESGDQNIIPLLFK